MIQDGFRDAIAAVRPDLADTPFTLHTAGWDSTAVEAGDTIFKFPKRPEAIPNLRKEARLLALIRPRVPLAVPDMRLHEAPTLFSEHRMIPGAMIETPQYDVLSDAQRLAMAEALAGFYAALHAIPLEQARAAGVDTNRNWPPSGEIMRLAAAMLPAHLHDFARRALAAYDALPPADPVLCYCDGHGWNMAFDHDRGVLKGLYDFADAELAQVANDLSFSNFISPELTERLVTAYELRTGRSIDRREVALHTAVQRLAELDADQKDPGWFINNVVEWAAYMQGREELRV